MSPYVINIMSTSLDGKIAFHDNESSAERLKNGLTNSADQEHLKILIASCDAVILGLKSFQTERGVPRVAHLRSTGDEPRWIFPTRKKPEELKTISLRQQATIPMTVWSNSLEDLWQWLHRTYPDGRIALLGGGQLNAAFWKRGWVDELYLTLCPLVVGQRQAPDFMSRLHESIAPTKLELIQTTCQDDGMVFLRYRRALSS